MATHIVCRYYSSLSPVMAVGLHPPPSSHIKLGKYFFYFYNDWLQEVFYHNINKDSPVCYLKTVCTPSNRLSDDPHSLWININKKTGTIYSAYCTCVAG